DQMSQAIDLYPIRIKEAESGLDAARAMLELATVNLERTEVRAPFEARVKSVNVEAGQFLSPGAPVLSLADDSTLELSVPLDSQDARKWLRFTQASDARTSADLAWFGELEPVTCKIQWTEAPDGQYWEGRLHRVETL